MIGTSSIRRRSQVINLRNDLCIKALRGNIDTRIKKLNDHQFDAIILSIAGLQRLSLNHIINYKFSIDEILPASCQGAVGIQMLSANEDLKYFLSPLNHNLSELQCKAERSVLRMIKANCNSPIGLLVKIENNKTLIRSEIFDHSGKKFMPITLMVPLYKQRTLLMKWEKIFYLH